MQAGFKKKQLFIRQSHKFIPSTLAQASSWFALRKPTRCVRYAPHHQITSQDTKKPPSGGISSDTPGGMIVRKVAVKSRRRRRSVRLYSTEPMSDDLTRDCARGPAGKKNAVRRSTTVPINVARSDNAAAPLPRRAVRALCAAPPADLASKIVRFYRRDDRAMITRKRQAT